MDRTYRKSDLTVGEIKTYLAMAAGIEDPDTILKWRLQILVVGPDLELFLMMMSDESFSDENPPPEGIIE
jgi:predicted lipid carrier protein YhbT